MYTHSKSNQFSFIRENRLAFMALEKGPTAEVVKTGMDTQTSPDRVAAATLKDEAVLWSKSNEAGGAVFRFMESDEFTNLGARNLISSFFILFF